MSSWAWRSNDFFGVVNSLYDKIERTSQSLTQPNAKLISITSKPLLIKSNFQDFQRYQPVDVLISGDGEATLPHLIEQLKSLLDNHDTGREQRGAHLRDQHKQALERSRTEAS